LQLGLKKKSGIFQKGEKSLFLSLVLSGCGVFGHFSKEVDELI